MTDAPAPTSLRSSIMTALTALIFGFLGAAIWSISGLADNRTRAFLIDNPEVLPAMVQEMQSRETARRLAEAGRSVFEAFDGAVLGNPVGTKVLVEWTDYNCPYCEASLRDVARLIAEDPDLKVVMRERPIFEGSEMASRMALAAALQGKYGAFHEAMFALGPTTPEAIKRAATAVGLDMERAAKDAMSERVTAELARNEALAQRIGFSGTPAWATGDIALDGAVGYEGLKQALDEAGPQAES